MDTDNEDINNQNSDKNNEDNDCVFHIKGKFKLHGFSMYDILITQETFQRLDRYKRSVNRIDAPELVELYKHPLIIDMKRTLEKEYGMNVKGVYLNFYKDGDDYAPYHKDSYGGTGIFTASFGASRYCYTKNDKTKKVTKYLLEDGDLFFFNSEFDKHNKHSIPKTKKVKDPRISVVFFV